MNKKLLAIIGLLLASIIVSWNLFRPGFFSMHDDLQVMRLFEMKRCLNDGQIPCRWAPDMSVGYGQPMFSYYSATPYYTGALIKSLGFSFLTSVKITMFISISLAGLAMFLFLSEFLSLPAAFVGGLAYLLVPFRALEIFVRGALAENFALALLPLLLYGLVRFLKNQSKSRFLALSLFTGLFLTTHNVTTLVASLLLVTVSLVLILPRPDKIKIIVSTLLSVLLGAGLASFFLLPVVFEGNLVDTSFLTSGYFNFRAHFVTLHQIFLDLSWGYGSSEFGPNDKMSFAVGVIQTIVLLVAPLVLFFKKKELNQTTKRLGWTLWLLALYYLFLTTARSVSEWEFFSPLRFVQFPWRLLGIVAVSTSALIGIVIDSFKAKTKTYLLIVTVISLFIFNLRLFTFEKYYPQASDATYLTGTGFELMQQSAFFDYRPLSMVSVPQFTAPQNPTIIVGTVELKSYQKRSNYFSVEVEVYNDNAKISFPISSFPNWKVYLNHSAVASPYEVGENFGEIILTFPKGRTLVQGYYENTPLRTVANLITFVSFFVVLIIAVNPHDKKDN